MGSKAELMEVLIFFQNGKLKPVIHSVLPLEEAQEAHRILENREAFGKVVLKMAKLEKQKYPCRVIIVKI